MGVSLGKEVDIGRCVSEFSPVVMVPGGVGRCTQLLQTVIYSHRLLQSAVEREVPSTVWSVVDCVELHFILSFIQ